jgi:hypothetical protein
VGKYVLGLEGCNKPTEKVECVVTPGDLVFAKLNGTELGRVPRNRISEVVVDDKSQITQRLTATRMVLLGMFALAAPKGKKIRSGVWQSLGRIPTECDGRLFLNLRAKNVRERLTGWRIRFWRRSYGASTSRRMKRSSVRTALKQSRPPQRFAVSAITNLLLGRLGIPRKKMEMGA